VGVRVTGDGRYRRTGRIGLAATAMAWTAGSANAASPVTDAEAVALAAKHCTACHSAEPTHPAFGKAPKGIRLDTIEGLRRYAKDIVTQVVGGGGGARGRPTPTNPAAPAMPLGNETDMTEAERERLGAWAEGRE
jgi:uncharacterized membrane protein